MLVPVIHSLSLFIIYLVVLVYLLLSFIYLFIVRLFIRLLFSFLINSLFVVQREKNNSDPELSSGISIPFK